MSTAFKGFNPVFKHYFRLGKVIKTTFGIFENSCNALYYSHPLTSRFGIVNDHVRFFASEEGFLKQNGKDNLSFKLFIPQIQLLTNQNK